jgi:hypothetical protein
LAKPLLVTRKPAGTALEAKALTLLKMLPCVVAPAAAVPLNPSAVDVAFACWPLAVVA